MRAASVIILVAILASFFVPSLQHLAPSISGTAAFGSLLLLGLVASVSTCLATTGGFLLAYVAKAPSRSRLVMVHLGRLTAFVLGGALLGALGGAVPAWSPTWYGLLAIILGVGFLGVSLQMFDLAPSWASLGIMAPPSLRRVGDLVMRGKGPVASFLAGAATFILPCGFTQTAQGLALASGSAVNGALLMAGFVLGTLPMLLGLTAFAAKAKLDHPALRLATGGMLFLFAIGQLGSGASLLGLAVPGTEASSSRATIGSNEQIVDMAVSDTGYRPSAITIKKGIPVRWQVYAGELTGCTNTLVSRELGISKRLDKGMNAFTFTPQRTGTIAFSCSMGMVRGSFTVIN